MIITLPNILYSVSFNASSKQVTISGIGDVYQFDIKKIVNITSGSVIIYDCLDPNKMGTISSNPSSSNCTITLNYNTALMNNNDSIIVTLEGNSSNFIFDAIIRQIEVR